MNEYFFLIGDRGLSVLAINAKQLDHRAIPRASFYRNERRLTASRFRQPRRDGLTPLTPREYVIFNPTGEL